MGEVYLAEQRTAIRRRVAIKVIKLGMDTKGVLARFELEHHALSLMNHANIARVYEAGATSEGRPYFVMEHVSGVPLHHYCDRERLSIPDRLRIFIAVCLAVQHAHQKGIIHRDLKSSNILVATQDGEPVPKIIDFGVAKATAQRLTEETLYTELGQMIGTLEYMSPEQTGMAGMDVDTRTDVYSLGVILYEILVGTLPFDPRTLRSAGYDEIQRILREVDPPRPSARLRQLERADADAKAKQRGVDARQLEKLLTGDLDWITMKALDKNRALRYESAAELGADVQRHLDVEPVLAGPPSAGYRAAKFVRRHRLAVVAGLSVALALLAGIAGTGFGFARALEEEERAKEQASQAGIARDESEAVTTFLTEMFGSVLPEESGRNVTVRETLDRASSRLGATFEGSPRVAARLRHSLGLSYLGLGRLDEAERELGISLDLYRSTFGIDHADTLRTMVNLAAVRLRQGRDAEAEELLEVAVEGFTRTRGADHPMTLGALSNLAVVHARRPPNEDTLALHRRVYEGQLRALGPEHPHTLGALLNLADLLSQLGRTAEAEPLAREAVEGFERVHGPENPGTLVAHHGLAMVDFHLGRLDEAEARMRRVVEVRTRVLGEQHIETLSALANLGMILSESGDDSGAVGARTLAFKGLRATVGDEHPTTMLVADELLEDLEAREWPPDSHALVEDLFDSARAAAERGSLSPGSMNRLAWLLVSARVEAIRDPEAGHFLAIRACELERDAGGANLWMYLDTLAAAQHAIGSHADAVATQQEALRRLPDPRARELRSGMETRLHVYEAAAGR